MFAGTWDLPQEQPAENFYSAAFGLDGIIFGRLLLTRTFNSL